MSHKNQLYGCLIGRSAGDIFITSKIYCGCDSRSGGAVGIATAPNMNMQIGRFTTECLHYLYFFCYCDY
jgi:hypothetical protein